MRGGDNINGYNQIQDWMGVFVYLCNSSIVGGSTNDLQLLYNPH